jgi:hypothetical protein
MPNIPFTPSREGTRNTGLPDSFARSSAGFGVGENSVGRGLSELSSGIDANVRAIRPDVEEEKLRGYREKKANLDAQFDQNSLIETARGTAKPDGSDMLTLADARVRQGIEDKANTIEDPKLRAEFRIGQLNEWARRRETVSSASTGMGRDFSVQEANKSLDAVANKLMASPAEYDALLAQSNEIIQSRPGLTPQIRNAMSQAEGQRLAQVRFTGMLQQAKTPEEVAAIQKDLKDPKWQSAMTTQAYTTLTERSLALKTQISNGQDAQLLGSIQTIEERASKNVAVPQEEIDAVSKLVTSMPGTRHASRFYAVVQQNQLKVTYGNLPPAQINSAAQRFSGAANGDPPDVVKWTSEAATLTNGVVSPSYLQGTMRRESGNAVRTGNFGIRAEGNSTATGLFQFIDGTWLDVIKKNAKVLGLSGSILEDRTALLALRSDPALNTKAAALYGAENAARIQADLGYKATDADLYMAHFLGGGGGVSFLRQLQQNPDAPIAAVGDFLQNQIDGNKSVFFKKDGTVRTFREVYENVSRIFVPTQSSIQFNNANHLRGMAEAKQARLNSYPASVAIEDGKITQNALQSADDFKRLGAESLTAANYYTIPITNYKPFTQEQEAAFTKTIKEASADEVLRLMGNIQAMGSEQARAAYKQLGETSPTFAHAASLSYDRDRPDIAVDIIKGQKRLNQNPDIAATFGATGDDIKQQFAKTTAQALMSVNPEARQSIYNAALAHYAETKGMYAQGKFDKAGFDSSIAAVMGGKDSIGKVNGEVTLLPKGVKAEEFDKAVDKLSSEDLVKLSVDGKYPKYADGSNITPEEISTEAKLRAIGGGVYMIEMSDGKFAVTDQNKRYAIRFDSKSVKEITARNQDPNAKPMSTMGDIGVSLDPFGNVK